MQEPSVLIIGAGTFGTSTAYHLAQTYKDPSRVTIIDRADSPPEPAAAIDTNRIIRTDYTNPLYCNLACEAIHDWFWKLELGEHFHKVGWLYLNKEGSNRSDQIRETLLKRGSTQTQDVDLRKLGERWRCLDNTSTNGFRDAYFNPEAGWCDAAAATKSIMDAAVGKGVRRITAEVERLLLDERRGKIKGAHTSRGVEHTADLVVLAAGAWTSSLLSPIEDQLNIPQDSRIEQQIRATGSVSAYYRLREDEMRKIEDSKMPVLIYGQIGEVVPPSQRHKLLRVCNGQGIITNTITTGSGAKITVPRTDSSQYDVPRSLRNETEEIISSKVLPDFTRGKQPAYWRICWDAVTPTEDWLLCKYPNPRTSNLILATGGSFHSYKFLPIAGRFVVNVLNGKSNGAEKDKAWAWKEHAEWRVGEGKAVPQRELTDVKHGEDAYPPKL